MAFDFEWTTGSDFSATRDPTEVSSTKIRKGRVTGTLPYGSGGDAFDVISSYVMGEIASSHPTMPSPVGTLYWNHIQLSEQSYATHYEVSVTYGPFNRQTGTFQISVDQGVGSYKITAGELIECFPAASAPADETGVFYDGNELVPSETPVNEDRITISYRHPQGWLNASYIRAVGRLRGYPNSDTFLGYDPGEVRYMGGNFTQSDCEASASYVFDISPNVTNLVIAGITITSKKGFDITCPVYEKDVGTTGGGDKHGIIKPKYIKIIRPKEWKAYRSAFGWG